MNKLRPIHAAYVAVYAILLVLLLGVLQGPSGLKAADQQPAPPSLQAESPAAKLATYEKIIPAMMRQRDDASSLSMNLQIQIGMLQAEKEALVKEVSELKEKLAKLSGELSSRDKPGGK